MRYLIIFSFLFQSLSFFGQGSYHTKNKKAIQLFEKAMYSYKSGQKKEAQLFYKQAVERDSMFLEAHLELGLLYAESGDFELANYRLKKVSEIDGDAFPEVYYYLGLFSMKGAEYDVAKSYLLQYLKYERINPANREKADLLIQNCEFVEANKGKKVEFNPVNLGPAINSKFEEYYPCLTADDQTLLYTRQIFSKYNPSGLNEDFYMSRKSGKEWSQSTSLGPPVNTMNNEGAPTLSVDGLLLIFTACELHGDYGPGRKGYGNCDLFFSQKNGSNWSKPRNLGKTVNTRLWESQPSFSSDGRTLYFVRAKRTSFGLQGQDIYQTYLTDTGWTKPVRLNENINTNGKEESVYIHPDGNSLYFASDGHPGYGGLDLFVSRKDSTGEWGKPENLGYPINTENDENSLMVNASGDLAYFASNREGGYGGLDLYSFELPEDKRPKPVTFMKGKVFDTYTKKSLLAKFELIDIESGEMVVESYSNGGNGEFLVCLPPDREYALNCSKKGYLFYSDHFVLNSEENMKDPFIKDVPMVPIKTGAKTVLNNIFFETNKYELKPSSKVELQKLIHFINTNPGIEIEIGGHTDNTGSKATNVTLSDNRANSVYTYLIENGIDASRLTYKGYADNEPIESNESNKGRAKNRRTEFKITKIRP